jgi:O-antigen ligase
MPSSAHQAPIPRQNGPLLPALAFLSPFVTSAAPQLTQLFLALLAVTLVVAALRRGSDWRELFRPNAALTPFILLAVYLCLSTLWAADPEAAFTKGALLLGVVLAAFTAANALPYLDERQLRRTALAFAVGAFAGALFVLVELLTEGLITRTILHATNLLEVPKRVNVENGDVVRIKLGAFRQNAGLVTLHLWPALLAFTIIADRARRMILTALLFVAVAATAFISERMSAQFALIASVLTFPLAMHWRQGVVRGIAVLWCLAFALVLPLSFSAYNAGLHMAPWLQDSARVRVIIWEFTAERVLERPWVGIGAGSTRTLKEHAAEQIEQPEGFIYPRKTGPHAHSLFLQTWYELGLVGVILFALAGVALLLRVPLMPREAQPFAAATFVTFATMLGFAWSMWQSWLVCGAGLTFLYLCMTAAAPARSGKQAPAANKAAAPLDAV